MLKMRVASDPSVTDQAEIISPWSSSDSNQCLSFMFNGLNVQLNTYYRNNTHGQNYIGCLERCMVKVFINIPVGDVKISFLTSFDTDVFDVVLEDGACNGPGLLS